MDRKERIIYWREQLRQIVRKDGATEALDYAAQQIGIFEGRLYQAKNNATDNLTRKKRTAA